MPRTTPRPAVTAAIVPFRAGMRWFAALLLLATLVVGYGRLGGFALAAPLPAASGGIHDAADEAEAPLATEPLSAAGARVRPNLVLDLSVEFPTVGAAYRDGFDARRSHVGYWDPMACYDYREDAGNPHFRRVAPATVEDGAILCREQWSGNLLNWAAASAIDMLRYALTGGDRVVDTPDATVLQRAMLPDVSVSFFRSGNLFPVKTLNARLDRLTPLTRTHGLAATGQVYVVSCRDKVFFGLDDPGTPKHPTDCAAPGGHQAYGPGGAPGGYAARVAVCDPTEGPLRPDLCERQPSGHHKPVGEIQRHADRVRLAAFGYLMGTDSSNYGGVLRAPMRFTGPFAQDASQRRIPNPAPEWDAQTGVFILNPLGADEGASGVVGYLNRFGRNGVYKDADPVGELYYESLRYLQGQAPTPQATRKLSEPGEDAKALKDGFPVYNDTRFWGQGAGWDPVQASCQKHNVLVIGDLFTHHDRSLPGLSNETGPGGPDDGFGAAPRPIDTTRGEPDAQRWVQLIGAFEANEQQPYTHPSGKTGLVTSGNALGPRPNAQSVGTGDPSAIRSDNAATVSVGSAGKYGSLAWAGLAYWANTQQIRADHPPARVRTFTIDVDELGDGAIHARQRGSAFYLAAKYGGFDDRNDDGNPFVTTDGAGQTVVSNAEWAAADLDADNLPRPANYFLASRPERMIAAVREIFRRVGAASGGWAGGAISSARVAASDAMLYVPVMDPADGSGSLQAYRLRHDPQARGIAIDPAPVWDAGLLLTGDTAAVPPREAARPAERRIFTLLSDGQAAAFDWASLSPDAAWKRALQAAPGAAKDTQDTLGEDRLAYLRGERGKELGAGGGIFRPRRSVMGDVVNAGPVLVGRPSDAIASSPAYADFRARHAERPAVVYQGANDGMLHAFAADTGRELFAYVPRALRDRLAALTGLHQPHQPMVDGPAAAAEVQGADGQWRTALVSGMGAGAKGVFALDVSDPVNFGAGSVLWEFGEKDDAAMGHITQAPRLLRLRLPPADAKAATQAPRHGWFVAVPSGFGVEPKQRAALFLLSLDKKPGEPWLRGTNYFRFDLPAVTDRDEGPRALGPVGDHAGADGTARLLFAGDTQGNLWRFDLSAASALKTLPAPRQVMVARDPTGRRQPITIAPQVGIGPGGSSIVLFGTGRLASESDLDDRQQQTLYAVQDDGQPIEGAGTDIRAQLQPRTAHVDGSRYRIAGEPFAYGKPDAKTGARRGWYLDLPQSRDLGERQVTDMLLADGHLVFNTLMPGNDPCGGGGGGRSCAVHAMNGLAAHGTCEASTVGMPGAPLLVQAGEAYYTATDALGRRTESRNGVVVSTGTGRGGKPGVGTSSPFGPAGERNLSQLGGRLSWRQVFNHKELRP